MGRLGIVVAGLAALVLLAVGMWNAGPVPDAQSDEDNLQRITFATDWKAQAEHGGFYQALAKGYYAKRGLEVQILPGGPGVNVPQLIAGGAVDFGMGSNSFIPLRIVEAELPVKAVMAVFQKDPQVLITHPRDDVTSLEDLKGKPIMISDATISAFWPWLRAKYGYTDDQIRKYTYNLAPFLVDETAVQQGYVTSEPYAIAKQLGTEPQVFLLADNGYPGYATMVLAPNSWIEESPDIVQAFVDGTIEGWYDYLHGDPAPADALILQDNPEISQDVLTQARDKMIASGLATSGDARRLGIGAMTEQRWGMFYDTMADAGVYTDDLDWRAAFTTDFVNQGPVVPEGAGLKPR